MYCNSDIHDYLKESEVVCPFCDEKIEDSNKKPKDDECCDNQEVITTDGMQVCRSCGVIQGYTYVKEYVDFYENRHRFIRKSVYNRKYHVNNNILKIQEKYGIELSNSQKRKIDAIYSDIGKVISQVNGKRKRMISINYIMRKIFDMMGIPHEQIPISKSKKTLAFYDRYWTKIMSLIGDKMNFIIG